MTDERNAEKRSAMAALVDQYLKNLAERSEELTALLKVSESGRFTDDQRKELVTISHKLAGTGATYGFPAISEAARSVELFAQKTPGTAALKLGCEEDELLAALSSLIEQIETARNAGPSHELPKFLGNASPSDPTSSGRVKPVILIVDDDPQVREVLAATLQDHATIMQAKDAALAIQLIVRKKPDIVLLDDSLPSGMSGLQLLEHLRDLPKQPLKQSLVIMVTANNRAQDFRRAMKAGAVDYITKPFSIDMVRNKVLKRLERRTKTVLIVDDDIDSRSLLSLCVHGAGFRSIEAEDAKTALATLEAEPADLILLDQGLPDRDGISVLQNIRENPKLKDLPVVMITADRSTATVRRAHQSGANDYCPKPFVAKDVVARCVRHIG